MKKVDIFADVVCLDSIGKCGWAAIMSFDGITRELGGKIKRIEKGRAELFSAISPLSLLNQPCEVALYSDSHYLADAFNKNYIYKWEKNGFVTICGDEVRNRDYWERLLELTRTHNVCFIKLRSHSEHPLTTKCEHIAREYVLKKSEIKDIEASLKKNRTNRGRF